MPWAAKPSTMRRREPASPKPRDLSMSRAFGTAARSLAHSGIVCGPALGARLNEPKVM